MRKFVLATVGILAVTVSGCVMGQAWEVASLRGRNVDVAERRYGPSYVQTATPAGVQYVWFRPGGSGSCSLTLQADRTGTITSVMLTGDDLRACKELRARPL